MKLKKIFFILTFAVPVALGMFLSSCTKDIDVKVPDYEQKLVVEGGIEPGQAPYVFLSWTAPYFGNEAYSNFEQYLVKGAVVTVNDGTLTDTLKEVFAGQGYYYLGLTMTGAVGKTYNLNIQINGETYTSSTTINPPVPLDSLWFKPEKDSLGFVWTHFKEPAGLGHRYRWYAKRIGKDNEFLAPFSSVFDDKFIDGKEFDFAYDRGEKPGSTAEDDNNIEKGYFKAGDSVVVKYCTIGDAEFRYLRSYYLNAISNGNPFAAPATLESNISNNAIGLWCGYGVFTKGVRLKQP